MSQARPHIPARPDLPPIPGVSRPSGLPAWGTDAGLAVLLVLAPALSQPSMDPSRLAWSLLLGFETVGTAAVVLRRRLPATAFLTVLAAYVVALVTGAALGAKLTLLASLTLAVVVHGLGSRCPDRRRTGAAVLGGVVLVLAGLWVNRLTADRSTFQGGIDVLAVLAPMPSAWALGFAGRTRRALLAAAEQRAADATREQRLRAEQAAERERIRIAHEMHDMVAHSLTLLVVQAEALRARGDELPDWARTRIDGLAAAGRRTGGELRDLLRMLRDPAEEPPRRPAPDLTELATLLDSHRAAGGTVDATVGTVPDALPRPVRLAAYRIVQEALSNARRHAPGAPVRLAVTVADAVAGERARLRLDVVNARPTRPAVPSDGSGLGLVSMAERVEALGGELTVGPTGDGGFRVLATMPLETPGA
ncbi:histidine kinase [Streptomyces sp. NPDC093085]|uniref:sensor histidine kinase n=1 Tax=Streptomyces sp. NPDC093085 TaxID=3155068 RepID=UPI00342B941D